MALITFAIDNIPSFQHATTKVCPIIHVEYLSISEIVTFLQWVPLIRGAFDPDFPFFLVGCKADLRTDRSSQACLIPRREAEAAAAANGARGYVECYAYNVDGVYDIFELAVKACISQEDFLDTKKLLQLTFCC